MLIRFTLENFTSFNGEQSLSMIKGKETRHQNHVNKDETSGFKTLRGAVMYGSNASGKSNFIKAISYAKNLIVENAKIDVPQSFKLDATSIGKPSSFNFDFKTNGKAYSYGFETLGSTINREWLYEISTTKKEKMLFVRHPKIETTANISFGEEIKGLLKTKGLDRWADLQATARTTPDDTLFLHDCKKRHIDLFLDPFEWFEKKLTVLNPKSVAEPFYLSRSDFIEFLNKLLKSADVGIEDIILDKDKDITKYNFPQKLLQDIENDLKNEGEAGFILGPDELRLIIKREEASLCVYRLKTRHKVQNGGTIDFELSEESDGTRRLIDLAPAFFSKDNPDLVLVIDELDRSLHPKITEMLHGAHFDDESRSNGQLIIATHEHYLLSQTFYRRDEIWFVEKDKFGISKLYSLSDFKLRQDKDIEKDYLLGRYGATPYVRSINA